MRVATLIVLGVLTGVGVAPAPARAIAMTPPTAEVGPSPNIVQVDRRCGPGRHWVRRHRNRDGNLVPGRCFRNR